QTALAAALAELARKVEEVVELLRRPLLQRRHGELEDRYTQRRIEPVERFAQRRAALGPARPELCLEQRLLHGARLPIGRERKREHEQQARVARVGRIVDLERQRGAQ